jgi:Tol biopolymer transport system component
LLKKKNEIKVPTSWSHDGRFLLYHTNLTPRTGNDLWVLPLEGDRKPVLLVGTTFDESQGIFSRDDHWIAYTANESGRPEIYVRPFLASGPSLGDGKWQISNDGGSEARWRDDGKEILFRALNGSVMAVDVNATGGVFQSGVSKKLFTPPPNSGWDVTGDGKRFLISVEPGQQRTPTPITVVLNWQADLKH